MNNKAPLINPESIEALRELSDPGADFYAEVAKLYLQQASAKVNEMKAAMKERNFDLLHGHSHQLKSSSAYLGANGLAQLFIRLEEAAKLKDIENLLRVFPEVLSNFSAVTAELEQIILGEQKQAA